MSPTQERTPADGQAPVRRFFRWALVGYAWLFLAALLVEIYLAGLMVWGQEGGHELHEGTGWMVAVSGALFLALPGLARAGTATIIVGAVLAISTLAQPYLASVSDSPLIAAFHPVNAGVMLALTILLIYRGSSLIRHERGTWQPTTSAEERDRSVLVGGDRSP